ncbi:MAG: hypothetical protein ABIJ28_02410 [Patescibacteria group bacterium]
MKKYFAIIIFIAVLASAILGYRWYEIKMKKIEIGLAEPNFPYRDYTQEELNKMYPQIKYADVATRIIPEETYAKFRQALKENNLEMAIEQLSKESVRYEENVDALTNFSQENKFQELYQHYPEKIEKSSMYESIAQYEYEYYSTQYKQYLIGSINFAKDANGDWKLDSL